MVKVDATVKYPIKIFREFEGDLLIAKHKRETNEDDKRAKAEIYAPPPSLSAFLVKGTICPNLHKNTK